MPLKGRAKFALRYASLSAEIVFTTVEAKCAFTWSDCLRVSIKVRTW